MDTQIVNISLPAKLLELIDSVAQKEARSRSDLVREAVRSYVLRKTQWNDVFAYAQSRAKKIKVKEKNITSLISDYRLRKVK